MKRLNMLIVNLSTGNIDIAPMREDLIRDYMGGEGTGTRVLWEHVPAGADPLGPENMIVFSSAPLNGTAFPAGPRGTVVFKSPETGTVSMSNMGGHWGARMRMAGYDLVAVTGSAPKPVYVLIDGDNVEVRDAGHLWGTTVPELQAALEKELEDPKIQVISIGPAGERKVRLACVANHVRFAGKGGSGAVMGSKNLKAVVIRAGGRVEVDDPKRLQTVSKQINAIMKEAPPIQMLKKGSSAAFNQTVFEVQDFGYKHFQEGGWTDESLYVDNIQEKLQVGSRACYACPIGCGVTYRIKTGEFKGDEFGGPMAEAYWNWGWKCGITDVNAIARIAELCNTKGVCVNSASELAAWIMECQEKGLLSAEDAGGLSLTWGDGPGCVRMMEMMIARDGFGDVIAEGVKRAAEKVGKGTEEYAFHVKGMELDGDEWRQNKASALTAATAERGASVVRPWAFPMDMGVIFSEVTGLQEKPDPTVEKGIATWYKPYKEFTVSSNCIGVCLYPALFNIPDVNQTLEGFTAITGNTMDLKTYLKIGERTICIQRAFNAREGFDRKDDTLPKRILNEPIKGGKYDGRRINDFDAMLDEYYEESGFDKKTGWPTREKLEELGLKDVADELYG
ncbi:MAG: aldehyde ferredoxin oxidoreductase family protein [Deltaproteobacteria bacterium]|nr:aldehyde ferredoxin oxidoreductase family protein [Deltaproteobacteria bacterium]